MTIAEMSTFVKKIFTVPERRVLVENFISLSVLQGLDFILPLITFPYLVRVLGPEKYGLINFAYSLTWYFIFLTDYGFNYSANRAISVNRENTKKISQIYSSVILIKCFLFTISLIILSLMVFLIPKFHRNWLLYYTAFLLVVSNILFPPWFFQGMERMKYITILNVVAKAIFTTCIFIFIKRAEDYLYAPLLNSLGYVSAGLISLWILYKHFQVRFVMPSFNELTHHMKEGWYVFVSTIAISAYDNTRVFAVGLLTNNTLTGFYVIAEKLINIMQSACLIPLAQTLYPRLSKIYAESPARSFRIMKRLQKYITVGYLIVLPIVFIYIPYIVKLIARTIYPETLISFRLLLIAIFFTSANAFRVQFLLVSGRKDIFAKIHVVAGALGVVLTFLFTHWLSYQGPAIALIIIEILVIYLTMRNIKKVGEVKEGAR